MTPESALPATRDALVECIRNDWSRLQGLLDSLTEEQLTVPLGDWSVKDHLAHLAAWHGKALAALQGRPGHEGLGLEERQYKELDEDGINEILHARCRDRPLPQVLDEIKKGREQIIEAIQQGNDADLQRSFDPERHDDRPVVDVVAGNTCEHYAEHLGWIREKLDRSRQ